MQFGKNKKDLHILQQFGEGNQILDATRDLNFQIFQQLNFITRELNININLVLKAKHGEHKSNLDHKKELIFRDKTKRGERKPDLDPMRDLTFAMYRWVLSKQNLSFLKQDLDNYQAIKFQRIVQALQMVSLNFDTFDICKTCALCGNPGYTFDKFSEVTNPILQELYILNYSRRLTHDTTHTTVSVTDIAHFPNPFQFFDCPNDKISTGLADDTSSILWFCFNEPVYCLLGQDQKNFSLNLREICGFWVGISTHTDF